MSKGAQPVDEKLKKLLEILKSDSELHGKIKAASSPEAAIATAREAVFKILPAVFD